MGRRLGNIKFFQRLKMKFLGRVIVMIGVACLLFWLLVTLAAITDGYWLIRTWTSAMTWLGVRNPFWYPLLLGVLISTPIALLAAWEPCRS